MNKLYKFSILKDELISTIICAESKEKALRIFLTSSAHKNYLNNEIKKSEYSDSYIIELLGRHMNLLQNFVNNVNISELENNNFQNIFIEEIDLKSDGILEICGDFL